MVYPTSSQRSGVRGRSRAQSGRCSVVMLYVVEKEGQRSAFLFNYQYHRLFRSGNRGSEPDSALEPSLYRRMFHAGVFPGRCPLFIIPAAMKRTIPQIVSVVFLGLALSAGRAAAQQNDPVRFDVKIRFSEKLDL